MFRFILNYDNKTHTISSTITPTTAGDILATAVVAYAKDAAGPGQGLNHLDQYGSYYHPNIERFLGEPLVDLISNDYGSLIHARFGQEVITKGVKANSPWETFENTPSFTVVEVLTFEEAAMLCGKSLSEKLLPALD